MQKITKLHACIQSIQFSNKCKNSTVDSSNMHAARDSNSMAWHGKATARAVGEYCQYIVSNEHRVDVKS